ncbi:MAG: hypothetical protein KDB22_14495, partial [Planctomycetales bacterium]|nr:hypothetical protein [Planctomycetales bacterium]
TTFLFVMALTCLFLRLRGFSRFTVLAIVLGLLGPVVSACYANWLSADLSRSFASAQSFEPIRVLQATWLAGLTVGLFVRVRAEQHSQRLSIMGQFAWLFLAACVVVLALVGVLRDPNPWWPWTQLSSVALLAAISGVVSGQAWRGHLAAVAAAAGLSTWLLQPGSKQLPEQFWVILWGPVWVALVSLACRLAGRTLSSIERPSPQSHPSPEGHANSSRLPALTVDQTVSLHVPIVSLAFSCLWLFVQFDPLSGPNSFTFWIVALSITSLILAVTRLWDVRPGKRGLSLYLSLLATAAVLCNSLSSLGEMPKLHSLLFWMASLLAAMAILAALLRELIRESSRLGPALKLGALIGQPQQYLPAIPWMLTTHTVFAILALVPCVVLVLLIDDRTMRVAATSLPLLGSLTILPLAVDRSRSFPRYASLLLISVTLVLLWWADLPQAWLIANMAESWIYWQRVFVAAVTLSLAYVLLASCRKQDVWERPLMIFGWNALLAACGCGTILVLGQLSGVWAGAVEQASLATKLSTIAAWFAIAARLLQFAARPTSTDQRALVLFRKSAVYVAELAMAGMSVAIHGAFPELFSSMLAQWWPLVMFAIAFASAGLGQWLHSVRQSIVADPLSQSSLLLPLIPLLGVWWYAPENVQFIWSGWDRYSLLLLIAAGVYGLHGYLRESIGLRMMAGAMILGSFWSLLHSRPDLRFLEHPQFWLLPPAIASLVFVEVNRKRLQENAVFAVRYVAILVAYLSSTAEVFLKAFEGQLWQPLLLLVLSLCGFAAGILLRVRAFLFCGTAFTFVALLGMVWHAQQAIGQVWPWWVFGIATGIGLIGLLGYFEKNRAGVQAYIQRVKSWDS